MGWRGLFDSPGECMNDVYHDWRLTVLFPGGTIVRGWRWPPAVPPKWAGWQLGLVLGLIDAGVATRQALGLSGLQFMHCSHF